MFENPSDWHLLRMLHKYMDENNIHHEKLHGLNLCTRTLVEFPQTTGVYVMSNGEKSSAFGVRRCHANWGCPVCEPIKMNKKAADISVAIEALKAKGYVACMITFTVPHHSNLYSCEQVSKILKNTWSVFTKRGVRNKYNDQSKLKNGTICRYVSTRHDALLDFRRHFECKFYVRVYEYTWGKNGWHPHIHALFWVKENKFNEVLDWEDTLLFEWRKIAERETIKVLTENNPSNADSIIENVHVKFDTYDMSLRHENNLGVYISKKDGKPIKQEASMYICGWGADKEVTSNYKRKASNDGHFSPYEMLLKAEESPPKSEARAKWLDRYLEYTIVAKSILTCRVHFGFKKEFHALIKAWKQTQGYIEYLKKKASNLDSSQKKAWYLAYWFSKEQWSELSNLELIPYIMTIAILPNAMELINFTLEQYDIKRTNFYQYGPLTNQYHRIIKLFNSHLGELDKDESGVYGTTGETGVLLLNRVPDGATA